MYLNAPCSSQSPGFFYQRLILRSLGQYASVAPSQPMRCLADGISAARAYFLSSSDDSENLARADAALQELVTSLDESTDHVRVLDVFPLKSTRAYRKPSH